MSSFDKLKSKFQDRLETDLSTVHRIIFEDAKDSILIRERKHYGNIFPLIEMLSFRRNTFTSEELNIKLITLKVWGNNYLKAYIHGCTNKDLKNIFESLRSSLLRCIAGIKPWNDHPKALVANNFQRERDILEFYLKKR